jgi:hypothetical protein
VRVQPIEQLIVEYLVGGLERSRVGKESMEQRERGWRAK